MDLIQIDDLFNYFLTKYTHTDVTNAYPRVIPAGNIGIFLGYIGLNL